MRRLKTYSAASGFVYRYFYCGQRPYRQGRDRGVEFVFDVSATRKTAVLVTVLVGDAAVAAWEAAHGRELTATDRYAVAKMALFQAFDERPDPAQLSGPVPVGEADVEAILERLDLT